MYTKSRDARNYRNNITAYYLYLYFILFWKRNQTKPNEFKCVGKLWLEDSLYDFVHLCTDILPLYIYTFIVSTLVVAHSIPPPIFLLDGFFSVYYKKYSREVLLLLLWFSFGFGFSSSSSSSVERMCNVYSERRGQIQMAIILKWRNRYKISALRIKTQVTFSHFL